MIKTQSVDYDYFMFLTRQQIGKEIKTSTALKSWFIRWTLPKKYTWTVYFCRLSLGVYIRFYGR